MNFLSVCSGIEAASVAWNPLGWKALAYSEIEKFPSALLAHHYPETPNLGDMTKFKEWPKYANVDLLCGGTPCQSFSVAGLRKGLVDPRGNLMLTFGSIAAQYRPRWLVWENVPGVLSSNKGRDFGSFLGLLGVLGYGFAFRVFDAQYFGVAQRRRRVFVVGYLGDWRLAAAVLFERHSLQRNTPPSREKGKEITPILEVGARTGNSTTDPRAGIGIGQAGDPMFTLQATKQHGTAVPDPAYCVSGGGSKFGSEHHNQDTFIAQSIAPVLTKNPYGDHKSREGLLVAHTLRGEGFDASKDGTGRGTPLVPVGIGGGDLGFALRANPSHSGDKGDGGLNTTLAIAFHGARVRRLTPKECERLQGFPDDYTAIPYRAKVAADGPRYKALGNSWAVPCARWIGERINKVEEIKP